MDNDRLSVTRNIPDDQRTFGVNYRVVGSAAMRAKAGDRLGHCPNVIFGVGFPKVHHIQTRQVEDDDGHSDAYRIKQQRIAWMGELGSRQEFRISRVAARSC